MSIAMNATGLKQLAMKVRSLEASRRFYEDCLKCRFLFEAEPRLAFLQLGETRIMLQEDSSQVEPRGCQIYVGVDNIFEFHQHCVLLGYKSTSHPHLIATMDEVEVWISFIEDPDARSIGLIEERLRCDNS